MLQEDSQSEEGAHELNATLEKLHLFFKQGVSTHIEDFIETSFQLALCCYLGHLFKNKPFEIEKDPPSTCKH